MKVTCPDCSAQYTIAAERLDGRRAKVRCKRCGESFPVDASQSAEVCARQRESRRGRDADLFAGVATAGAEGSVAASPASQTPPLTGERNESSVLFSLAALSKQAPAAPPPKVTESSALIDIRALMSASKEDGSTSRADDIMNLSGGGAFAPLFAPPVTFVPAENEAEARSGQRPIVVAAMALAVVAMVGVAAFVGVRSRPSAPANATAATAATAVSAPAEVPSVAGTAPSSIVAVAASEAPPASSTRLAAVTPVTTTTAKRTVAAQVPTTSTVSVSTTSPPTKCCPGESEMACQMRLSTGAACGAATQASTATSAPPFDRPAAARALGINVASCKRADGPTGAGHVKVMFQPGGTVSAVDVDAPYAGTATGTCVAQRFRGVSVPAFAGGPLSVGKSFAIE